MAQPSAETWRDFFLNWPEVLPRRGLVVSTLNEPIPFKGFLIKGEMLLLERANPDQLGTRFIAISYDAIHLLKITDPLNESVLHAAGFKGHLAKV